MASGPRLLRPVSAPLGLYLRPGRNDHSVLLGLLAEGHTDLSGVVFDPCLEQRQAELRIEALKDGVEAVLDPRSIDLATLGGMVRSGVSELPWAGDEQPHTAGMLGGPAGERFIEALVAYVVEKEFSAVLAPTHYLSGARDPWAAVDAQLTQRLRRALDAAGRTETCIYYPLAVPGEVLRDGAQREQLVLGLSNLPIDAVWLRVHPFGTTSSGPLALRRYIEACRDLQRLGVPLVAEHTGTVGVALLAFGAVGGIESGITYGERYDVSSLLNPPKGGNGFSPAPRVYLANLGAFVSRDQARELFENRQMKTLFACRVSGCCPRGAIDMTADPRRHFVLRRAGEVSYYSRPPEPVRAGLYLEEFLRPATDLALRGARVTPALDPTRRRLEGWRRTLGALHQDGLPATSSLVPRGQRVRARQVLGA